MPFNRALGVNQNQATTTRSLCKGWGSARQWRLAAPGGKRWRCSVSWTLPCWASLCSYTAE